jgi:hypothetical protein
VIFQLQERLAAYGDRERELQRKLMEAELKLEQQVRRSHWIMRCMLVDEAHPSRMGPSADDPHLGTCSFPPQVSSHHDAQDAQENGLVRRLIEQRDTANSALQVRREPWRNHKLL